jgi:hypothetical protein
MKRHLCLLCKRKYTSYTGHYQFCRKCSPLKLYMLFTPTGIELTEAGRRKVDKSVARNVHKV